MVDEQTRLEINLTFKPRLCYLWHELDQIRITPNTNQLRFDKFSLNQLTSKIVSILIFTGTSSPKGSVQFRSCNKAVVNVLPHKAEPSCTTRTGQYLLDC